MQFIKPFKDLNKKSVDIAGGKGASLGEMLNSGLPVPDGFVVLADAFDKFMAETDIEVEIEAELAKVNKDDVSSVDAASHVIQALILNKDVPRNIADEILKQYRSQRMDLVAVRSSATCEDFSTASWAGELESCLMVTEDNLLDCVKRCWASLFTPRAIFYRIEKGMSRTKVSVAVVVQKMIDSEVSGITFTVHPVTKDRDQMIIEAGYGLGEAIVGGLITPDAYVVSKKTKKILDVNVATQEIKIVRQAKGLTQKAKTEKEERESQKLSEKHILELADLCIKIEKHYKFPCDIEWAYEKGRFYVVQSRPITTL